MPRGGLADAKPAAKWGLGYENEIFKALGISQRVLQLRNGTRVPTGGFAAAKIFRWSSYEVAKSFHNERAFSQPTLDFAAGILWLRNHFAADGQFRIGLS